MKKTIIIILIAAVSAGSIYAESDFEKWKKKQQKAFKSYLSEQEKAFSDMLKKEWEEFQAHTGFIHDTEPKPDIQPKVSASKPAQPAPDAEVPEKTETSSPSQEGSGKPSAGSLKQDPVTVLPEAVKQSPGTKPGPSSAVLQEQDSMTTRPGSSKSLSGKNQESSPVNTTLDNTVSGLSSAAVDGSAEGGSLAEDKNRHSKPEPADKKKGLKYIKINFYGSQFSVPLPENLKIREKAGEINNKTISDFFEYYSEQKMDETALWMKSLGTDYKMNGWSVLKIAEITSKKLYSTEKDIRLMTWFLLVKSAYDVKIAYSSAGVYLLYVPEVKVYAAPYITEKKKHYYFYNKTSAKNERIRTYSGSFVKNPAVVKLAPENPGNFNSETMSRKTSFRYSRKNYSVNLEYNNSLIKYYKEYPQLDISYYFKENISDKAAQSYRKSLYPYIKSMNETEAVQFILTFVQTGFKYKTDGRQFGYEKPMFPDETLHYPYIDCEDRSSLFISIVRELTGLDAVALDYPGHIAAAVNFRSSVKGDYISYKGRKYTVCDPTYINASIGMTMPDYKNIKPHIIEAGR